MLSSYNARRAPNVIKVVPAASALPAPLLQLQLAAQAAADYCIAAELLRGTKVQGMFAGESLVRARPYVASFGLSPSAAGAQGSWELIDATANLVPLEILCQIRDSERLIAAAWIPANLVVGAQTVNRVGRSISYAPLRAP